MISKDGQQDWSWQACGKEVEDFATKMQDIARPVFFFCAGRLNVLNSLDIFLGVLGFWIQMGSSMRFWQLKKRMFKRKRASTTNGEFSSVWYRHYAFEPPMPNWHSRLLSAQQMESEGGHKGSQQEM